MGGLLNLAWTCAVKPESWCVRLARPLLREGDPIDFDNYRILALGTALGQMFEQVWMNEVGHEVGNRVDPLQIGHRAGVRERD